MGDLVRVCTTTRIGCKSIGTRTCGQCKVRRRNVHVVVFSTVFFSTSNVKTFILTPTHLSWSPIASGQRPQERQELPPELMVGCKVCRKNQPKPEPLFSTQPRPRGMVPVGPTPTSPTTRLSSLDNMRGTSRSQLPSTNQPPLDRQDSSPRSSDSKGETQDLSILSSTPLTNPSHPPPLTSSSHLPLSPTLLLPILSPIILIYLLIYPIAL